MTKDTLDQKLKQLDEQETRLLAALRQNQANAEQLNAQRLSLERDQNAVQGARLMIQQLQKELADASPEAPQAPVVPINSD